MKDILRAYKLLYDAETDMARKEMLHTRMATIVQELPDFDNSLTKADKEILTIIEFVRTPTKSSHN